uniref:Protein-serine/threonine kinase n=1 Tax=Gopherus evgoodei TaxID=1825980 RepID=A0A8C4YJ95_9SAUR
MRAARVALRSAAPLAAGGVSGRVPREVERFSRYSPSPLSIQQFLDFGSSNGCERTSFAFLRQELPVRLANILREIDLLPDQLLSTPSVQLYSVQNMVEKTIAKYMVRGQRSKMKKSSDMTLPIHESV